MDIEFSITGIDGGNKEDKFIAAANAFSGNLGFGAKIDAGALEKANPRQGAGGRFTFGKEFIEKQKANNEKSLKLARKLFSGEKWMPVENGIYAASGRLHKAGKNDAEKAKFEKEKSVARTMTRRASVFYFLPEPPDKPRPDAVMDGETTEIKKLSGNRNTLGEKFGVAVKQGHSVLLWIETDIEPMSLYEKFVGTIKQSQKWDAKGQAIVYFSQKNAGKKLYLWDIAEIAEAAKKKAPKKALVRWAKGGELTPEAEALWLSKGGELTSEAELINNVNTLYNNMSAKSNKKLPYLKNCLIIEVFVKNITKSAAGRQNSNPLSARFRKDWAFLFSLKAKNTARGLVPVLAL